MQNSATNKTPRGIHSVTSDNAEADQASETVCPSSQRGSPMTEHGCHAPHPSECRYTNNKSIRHQTAWTNAHDGKFQ